MKHTINMAQLDRRFPTDEYGRPGIQLVHESEVDRWLDDIGLAKEEQTFGCLVLASLPGDFSDETLVGIFGGDHYTPGVNEVLTTIWWGGELTQPFKDANAYWKAQREEE